MTGKLLKINERLLADTVLIKDLELSQLRLMKDGDLDWLVLIPKKDNCVEVFDLTQNEQHTLIDEIAYVSEVLKEHANFDKLNIATIGNIVQQMHVHIVARLKTDRAWPGVIWGSASLLEFKSSRTEFWTEKFKN